VTLCRIERNVGATGRGQIEVRSDAHDLVFEDNDVVGVPEMERAGIYLAPSTERIWVRGNRIAGCFPAVVGGVVRPNAEEASFGCGADDARPIHYRHLKGGAVTSG